MNDVTSVSFERYHELAASALGESMSRDMVDDKAFDGGVDVVRSDVAGWEGRSETGEDVGG